MSRMARRPAKKALVLINRYSGTVRSRGAEAVQALLRERLDERFPGLELAFFGDDVVADVKQAAASGKYHTIIAGGGDGTIAAAASALLSSDIVLGALPLGTMNLFVQALGISPVLEQAVDNLATSRPQTIDVGFANDRIFLHQVSFGLQPRLARLRERIGYRSRFTKMWAGFRALAVLAANPKRVRVNIAVDGAMQVMKVPLLIISNNRLGHALNFSVQASLTDGELGVYALRHFSLWTLLTLARDHLANRLIVNPALDMMTAKDITILPRRHRLTRRRPKSILASLDGEVARLSYPVIVTLKPRQLKVLAAAKPTS
jgi:diacylglycerol kinase family enzyme